MVAFYDFIHRIRSKNQLGQRYNSGLVTWRTAQTRSPHFDSGVFFLKKEKKGKNNISNSLLFHPQIENVEQQFDFGFSV